MSALAAERADRLSRKAERALTVAMIFGTVEIIRRAPAWLLIVTGLLLYVLVMLAFVYVAWLDLALGSIVVWKLGRGARGGWVEAR